MARIFHGLTPSYRIRYTIRCVQDRVFPVAASASISKSECFRCFSELSKTTPIEYINQFRLLQAAQALSNSGKSISDICYATGFNNTSYFSKRFKEQYGMSPKAYRAKHHAPDAARSHGQ